MKSKLLSHLIGPFTTFAITVLIKALSQFEWYTPSLALAFIGLAISAIYGGLWSSLASATIIVTFGLVEIDFNIARIIQMAIGAYSIAVVNGVGRRLLIKYYQEAEQNRHAANLINAANGNLGKLREIHLDSIKLVDAWKSLGDAAKLEVVNNIRGNLGHVLTIWEGWHALFQEREMVKWENLRQKLGGKND